MNYIGICGHRGAGKNSISYLLGNIIEYLIVYKDIYKDFDNKYKCWCDELMKDSNVVYKSGTNHVYYESFADGLKLLLTLLTNIPQDYFYDDYFKDNLIINLKDFSYQNINDLPKDIKIFTHNELYKEIPKDSPIGIINKDVYITLRDFILYFSQDVMKRFFGENVWIKSLNDSVDVFDTTHEYRIFVDVKTVSENIFIKNKGGVIVNITRNDNIKESSDLNKLPELNTISADYNISVQSDLYSLKDELIELAFNIMAEFE